MGQEDPCQLCPANLNPASAEWLKKVAQLKQAKTSLSTWLTSPWFTCLISAKAVDARKIKKNIQQKNHFHLLYVCVRQKKIVFGYVIFNASINGRKGFCCSIQSEYYPCDLLFCEFSLFKKLWYVHYVARNVQCDLV